MPEKRVRDISHLQRLYGDFGKRARKAAPLDASFRDGNALRLEDNKDVYTSLDLTTNSIRLIRTRSELSSTGLIQCDMRIGSIQNTYTCLSYVWGEEPASQTILIGDKAMAIRPNLHDFLEQAMRRHHHRWFWIDALCINQSQIAERNHQVQQMGRIYAQADRVFSWLGNDEGIVRCLDPDKVPGLSHVASLMHCTDYWGRAWITQEVALARHVTLMAGCHEMDLEIARVKLPNWRFGWSRGIRDPSEWNSDQGKSLIALLEKFQLKSCAVWQDKVYSLLALCRKEQILRVDYKVTQQTLLTQIVACSLHEICFCTIRIVADAIGLGYWEARAQAATDTPFAEFKVYGSRCSVQLSQLCSRMHTRNPPRLLSISDQGELEMESPFMRGPIWMQKTPSDWHRSEARACYTVSLSLAAILQLTWDFDGFRYAESKRCAYANGTLRTSQLSALRLCNPSREDPGRKAIRKKTYRLTT